MDARGSVAAHPLDDLAAAETAWLKDGPDVDTGPGRYGLACYPLGEFTWLLALAMSAPRLPARPVFADVGAGIGTKVIAAARAGCTAWGVEAVPEYADAARDLGADVTCCDAEDHAYSGVNIAFVNCPYADLRAEWRFEQWFRGQLRRGAVLISVNHFEAPPWPALLDEPGRGRGVYTKP